jgi:hypothetical protein
MGLFQLARARLEVVLNEAWTKHFDDEFRPGHQVVTGHRFISKTI